MSAAYAVREGKVRGEGRYRGYPYPASKLRWVDGQRSASRYDREEAAEVVRDSGGRLVRIVTLSEQLRRAKKRTAELEYLEKVTPATCQLGALLDEAGLTPRIDLKKTKAYEQGRADERAAVVDSLRLEAGHFDEMSRGPGAVASDYAVTLELARQAKRIESGEHVKGGG